MKSALLSWCCFGVAAGVILLGQTIAAQAPPTSETKPAGTTPVPLTPGLYAEIDTSMGKIICRLLPKEAPKTVANFVGLATGKKPWTDPRDEKEKHTPFYTGLTFHRVIKGFMIQAC